MNDRINRCSRYLDIYKCTASIVDHCIFIEPSKWYPQVCSYCNKSYKHSNCLIDVFECDNVEAQLHYEMERKL